MADSNTKWSCNSFHGKSIKDEDFNEEAAWDFPNEEESSSPISRSNFEEYPRLIPKAKAEPKIVKIICSAPLDIPDWSKIYGIRNGNGNGNGYVDDDDDGDGDGDVMVPPHEWIARKVARRQISSFSVCEGIGRTLKGRDLSKVRNDILTKTGFLE